MSIILERGQRGILCGHTGSGKTWGAIFQLQYSPMPLVIVLDTKGEPAFNTLALEDETIGFYESGDDFLKALYRGNLPTFMIVRPSPHEIAEPLEMDSILMGIYNAKRECLVYVDEAYQWHVSGRAGAGLTGLLTRGRSKGISTLLATQRPAWISRFCFSEAQKFFVYKLNDRKDYKTISDYIPTFDVGIVLQKYNFMYYDNSSDMSEAKLYAPVPKPLKLASVKPSGKRWI